MRSAPTQRQAYRKSRVPGDVTKPTVAKLPNSSSSFLLSLGLLACLTTFVIHCLGSQLLDHEVGASGTRFADLAWVLLQTMLVLSPLLCITLLGPKRLRGVGRWGIAIGFMLLPIISLLNLVTLGWIGQPFLSSRFVDAIPLIVGLTPFLSVGVIAGLGLVAFSILLISIALPLLAKAISQREGSQRLLSHSLVAVTMISLAAASPAILCWPSTKERMRSNPSVHPLCTIGIVPSQTIGPRTSSISKPNLTANSRPQPLNSEESKTHAAIRNRIFATRQLSLVDARQIETPPDVLLVIVESLRPELVDSQTMPNLKRLADRGIFCESHFSGGNATNHGIFSIVTGLEAVWYDTDLRFSPTLNRLFRNAGYTTGFFGGDDDWRQFYMDGFINENQFDVFDIRPRNGLRSDRRTIEKAAAFLSRNEDSEEGGQPRLAVVYLYSTHAMYESYAEDRVFEPAADDRFLYPFPSMQRPRVWNRYKNSARSVDRLLSVLYRDDLVTIVTGDHGEAFLEDTTIGHGIRISKYQNQTPAVIYAPHLTPQKITAPTMHADLLPTLVSLCGFKLSVPRVLDGLSLPDASVEELRERFFLTRNYLQRDVALIGKWTNNAKEPYAYRGMISVADSAVSVLNPIDERGFELDSSEHDKRGAQLYRDWLDKLSSYSESTGDTIDRMPMRAANQPAP